LVNFYHKAEHSQFSSGYIYKLLTANGPSSIKFHMKSLWHMDSSEVVWPASSTSVTVNFVSEFFYTRVTFDTKTAVQAVSPKGMNCTSFNSLTFYSWDRCTGAGTSQSETDGSSTI